MSFSPIMLASLGAFEIIINKALSLDSTSQQKLKVLDGKIIAIRITNWNTEFFILINQEVIRLQSALANQPDVTLTGSVQALTKLMTSHDKTVAMLTSDIEISGDNTIAQILQSVFSELDIDWEAQLSQLTGGVLAHQFGEIARSLNGWVKNTFSHFTGDVKEFLNEEAPFITPRGKVDAYLHELDQIKMRMDRIDAHMARLNEKLKNSRSGNS